jgi:hypothetical protein
VSLMDWLMGSAEVSRSINGAYMIVVSAIALSVLAFAIYTKDRNAIRLYILSIPIWLFIEGFGLFVWGVREYSSQVGLTYFVVAVMEDPGWVTLSYMVAWRVFQHRFPRLVEERTADGEVTPGSSASE